MNKKTKHVIALTAAVTALSASLGVAVEEGQAAVDQTKKVATDAVKQSTQSKSATQVKVDTIKQSTKEKVTAPTKQSNQIKWEYKK